MQQQNIWIVGYGGIGAALTRQLTAMNTVTVFTRKSQLDCPERAQVVPAFNYSDEAWRGYFAQMPDPQLPSLVIVTCGCLHTKTQQPEKTIRQFSEHWLQDSVAANVLPTALLAKHLTPKLSRSQSVTMVCFSARVGSISDNVLGGWHSYRMAKAMLNMLVKNISHEWCVKSPASCIIAYHPGTVSTPLSAPFKSPAEKHVVSPFESAVNLLSLLKDRDAYESGHFYDYQGTLIAP